MAHVCRKAVWAYVTVFREVLKLPENKVVVACSPTVCSHGIPFSWTPTLASRGSRQAHKQTRVHQYNLEHQPLNLASVELDPFLWESSYKSSHLLPASAASGRARRPAQSTPNAQPRARRYLEKPLWQCSSQQICNASRRRQIGHRMPTFGPTAAAQLPAGGVHRRTSQG